MIFGKVLLNFVNQVVELCSCSCVKVSCRTKYIYNSSSKLLSFLSRCLKETCGRVIYLISALLIQRTDSTKKKSKITVQKYREESSEWALHTPSIVCKFQPGRSANTVPLPLPPFPQHMNREVAPPSLPPAYWLSFLFGDPIFHSHVRHHIREMHNMGIWKGKGKKGWPPLRRRGMLQLENLVVRDSTLWLAVG